MRGSTSTARPSSAGSSSCWRRDEATIKRAAELAAGGQSFTQVAEALKDAKVERSEVGPLAKGDLPEALDAAGFALAPGAVSAPVQTPFGWHLLRAQRDRARAGAAVRGGQGGAARAS